MYRGKMSVAIGPLILVLIALAGCQGAAPTPAVTQLPPIMLPASSPTPGTLSAQPVAVVATATLPARTPPAATRQAPGQLAPAAGLAATPAPRLMAIGAQAAVVLRSRPDSSSQAVVTVPGSDVLWAEGRSVDGSWFYVAYGESGGRAWVPARAVTLLGDPAVLPLGEGKAQAPAAVAPQGNQAGQPSGGPTGPGAAAGRVAAGSSINVREGPGTDQPVLGTLEPGAAVAVTGRSSDGQWLTINWQGRQAWVAAALVTLGSGAPALPTVAHTTTEAAISTGQARGGTGQGLVAFQTQSGGDIYVVRADGSGLRRIASGMDPAFSPDGTRLAYTRWQSGDDGVYVFDLRTGQEQRVTGAARPRGPAWNAAGDRLVFTRFQRTCLDTPFGCLTDKEARVLFRGQDCMSVPRVGEICLSQFPQKDVATLAEVSATGGDWTDLPSEVSVQSPAWRPGQRQLLYRNEKGLQLLDNGNAHLLMADAGINSPAWSPDGQRIAFQARVHDHSDIFVSDGAGNNRVALTKREPLATRAVNNVAPTWSPDGSQILFLTDRDGAWRLYTMNADGSGQRPFLAAALASLNLRYDFAAERVASWAKG